ncbi:ABC transporter ATP-binding protein [Sphaerisporangium flaviroseum]|uniref:ABC transporter ATP-binding protein n=1 Tax=Sphaerisporangium flaviroseum TaxID=509199 RepID=A0ABP7HWS8_9ACTN
MIRFDAVSKVYPDGTTAVDTLDMVIPEGRITVLVGSSGCGKTTTLRMINRMIEASSGTVTVGGRNIADLDENTLRRGIGYVIQQSGLFPHKTVLDNVATVPRLLGWDKKKARARAAELMETVGLPESMADRYPHQLSGGQQQRVGVARALAADPPVLLMDEPFGAVDPVVRTLLQDELLRLQSELRKTIVFVTHDIDEAVRLGDRIAVFRTGGRLVQFAPPAELLARPADEFVAGFLGAQRGLKLLSLTSLSEVPTIPVATVEQRVSVAEALATAARAGDRWLLAVREDGAPRGWLDTDGLDGTEGSVAGHVLVAAAAVGGADSLLAALDAVVASPCGLVVRVDDQGRVAGASTERDVIDAASRYRDGVMAS